MKHQHAWINKELTVQLAFFPREIARPPVRTNAFPETCGDEERFKHIFNRDSVVRVEVTWIARNFMVQTPQNVQKWMDGMAKSKATPLHTSS